jgi:hypothetical protein
MTQEQKRIKLAEAGGWRVHPKDRFLVIPPNSPHSVQPLSTIPDYFNDLNAVHELEKVLRPPQQATWDLWEGYCRRIEDDPHATAAQRCEALGLTLGLGEAAK